MRYADLFIYLLLVPSLASNLTFKSAAARWHPLDSLAKKKRWDFSTHFQI